MTKIIKQDGFFSKDGENFISSFSNELSKIFSSNEIKNMPESELKIFGSLLKKQIGDAVANNISNK